MEELHGGVVNGRQDEAEPQGLRLVLLLLFLLLLDLLPDPSLPPLLHSSMFIRLYGRVVGGRFSSWTLITSSSSSSSSPCPRCSRLRQT